jgi:hypothetical protein
MLDSTSTAPSDFPLLARRLSELRPAEPADLLMRDYVCDTCEWHGHVARLDVPGPLGTTPRDVTA